MNPNDRKVARNSAPDDELLRLEMKIAQRADRLWQDAGRIRGNDLAHWLRAEQEVLVELALAS
ncbi:MAG TPA: DUF2934 domain-containing protein [Opitutaceae bacterium]|jgi:hypothetical protein|nr:DUF2934 domain-containing protein [Opitutaceae bacterium]